MVPGYRITERFNKPYTNRFGLEPHPSTYPDTKTNPSVQPYTRAVPTAPTLPNHMPRAARYTLAQRSNFIPITAQLYDTWRERSLSLLTGESYTLKREFALMLEWLQPQPDQHYLDVGTSTGNYARVLADNGAHVTAIDISRPMLEKAASLSTGHANIGFEQANVETLPYPDSSFDGVVVGASLNEFHDTNAALREMARVLKPRGKLFMMYLRESDTGIGRLVQTAFKLSGVRFPNRERLKHTFLELNLELTRAEVRRAVAMELYTHNPERPATPSEPLPRLARAAGKPARDPIR
ncbi:MAG: class I SAM-dependent methyltransferase [Pleurocapsa sp. SU_196_0]|nr:class I SAM-dependent methyltransferase [Pleurocapsa sp. SU_196_0]